MIKTARFYVMAGCPHTLEVQPFSMPPPSSLQVPFYGMRALILHRGCGQILRVIRSGLCELQAVLELLDHSEIEGVQDVLKDVLGFAEDVVHMCNAIQQKNVDQHGREVADFSRPGTFHDVSCSV